MPTSFRDTQGRVWEFNINLASIRRVKSATGIFLPQLIDLDQEVFGRVCTDPVLLFDVLVSLLQPQLDARGVSAEQLGESLDQAACESALEALLESVIFFSRPERREVLLEAFLQLRSVERKIMQERIDQARRLVQSPQFSADLEQSLRMNSSASAATAPASSASPPTT